MSVLAIDFFSFINFDSEQTDVNVYFNTETQQVTYDVTQGGLTSGSVTELQRGRAANSLITQVYNDAATVQYTILAQLANPFAYVSNDVPVDPQPSSCDLILTTVLVSDETAQGANDGSVGVGANSSYPGIQVSINNVDFFASPHVFGPIAPGNYVAYAKDSNDCTATQAFTVQHFNNPITGGFSGGLPQVEVGPGLISRWNAAYNPIVLNFQTTIDPAKKNYRIEIEITSQAGVITGSWSPSPAGQTRADISAYLRSLVNTRDVFKRLTLNWRDIDRAASFTIRYREVWDAGNSVWYNAPQPFYVTFSAMQLGERYGGNMAEYVPMTAGGAIAPTTWYYALQQTASPDYIDANLQIKANSVDVKTVFTDESSVFTIPVGQPFSIEAFVNDPTVAAGAFLVLQVTKNGTVVYNQVTPNVPGASLVYTGTTDYGAVYGVFVDGAVISDPGDLVNIPDSTTPTPTGSNLAKWLTRFKEPTAWIGLPFDLSFIFSEYLITKDVKLRTTSLDINRQPTPSGVVNDFLLNNDSGYILGSDTGKLIIREGALSPVSNDGILEQLGINRLQLAGAPFTGVEYYQMQLYIGADASPEYVTQPIVVRLVRPCTDPYIMIKWLNTLGGWDYWRFGVDQIKSLTTSNAITVDRNVFDWENDETIEDNIQRNAVRKISFGASVDRNDLEGLTGLHKSIRVQFMYSSNPEKWHTGTIATGNFEVGRTRNKYAEVKFTLSLPAENIQQNGAAPYLSDPALPPVNGLP